MSDVSAVAPHRGYLFPKPHPTLCDAGHRCPQAVVQAEGAYWITFGHCGFNSAANNGFGYRTEAAARAAIRRHQRPHFTAAIEARKAHD